MMLIITDLALWLRRLVSNTAVTYMSFAMPLFSNFRIGPKFEDIKSFCLIINIFYL
jgi:hypothetical protein